MDNEGVASQAREMAAAKNRSYEANVEELERKFGISREFAEYLMGLEMRISVLERSRQE